MWPNDADGDVLRRLEATGFDFATEYEIDFNVDFAEWPPHAEALSLLRSKFPSLIVIEPQDDFNGYVQFKLMSKLTYALVVETQAAATAGVQPYGGTCDSWGVLRPAQ